MPFNMDVIDANAWQASVILNGKFITFCGRAFETASYTIAFGAYCPVPQVLDTATARLRCGSWHSVIAGTYELR